MTALFVACLDQRGAALLPRVLPSHIAGDVPAVYLDADFDVHCASCANSPRIRPFITSFDAADVGDTCSLCGFSFGGA